MENKFIKATRDKLKFPTTRGMITVEDVWDMPLIATDGFDLNTLAGTLDNELETKKKKNYVKPLSKDDTTTTLKFEIVEFIIEVKIAEKEQKENAKVKAAQRKKILSMIAEKDEEEMKGKSKEELLKELEALDD